MKRLTLYLTLSFCSILLLSCSLKHKWRTHQKENLARKKQEHISHVLTSERVILDTSIHFSHSKLINYRLWHLTGNVNIHANGTIQTDHATLESWHSETDKVENHFSKTVYQNHRIEDQLASDESIFIQTKSTQREKRKATTNLWWLVLLLVPLGVLFALRFRRLRF